MRGHADIIRALEREPRREFSTTQLVDALYPHELRAIRERHEYGTKEQRHHAQTTKSALHRKALYHLGRLVSAGILDIVRLDAHGEKVYRVMPSVRGVDTRNGTVSFDQRTLNTSAIADDLQEKTVFLYDEPSALTRYNAAYIDAVRLDGLGQVLRIIELTVRLTDDVVAIGGLHAHKKAVMHDDTIRDFISSIAILTLDEGRRCVLMLETRNEDCLPFVRALTTLAPRRVSAVLVVDAKSLQQTATQTALMLLKECFEKVTIHYAPSREEPVFPGRAGPHGFSREHYARFTKQQDVSMNIVTVASACIDLERLQRQQPRTVRETLARVATTLFSVAAQQRLIGTGASLLQTIHPEPSLLVRDAAIALRLWNYDWESLSPVIASAHQPLLDNNQHHANVYRACGIAVHPRLQLSSAFPKFHSGLSGRSYRKWTVQTASDLLTPAFMKYRDTRLAMGRVFDGIDRFRVFRAGQPSGNDIATELNMLGAAGFALITYDFKPLVGVRRLTDFFEAPQ